MAFAKPCKFCKTVQVVWDEHLQGSNKYKEVQTNLQHSKERCDAAKNTPVEQQVPMYNPQEQKQFVEQYRPQQKSETTNTNDFQLAQLITKVDNLAIGIAKIMSQEEIIKTGIENIGSVLHEYVIDPGHKDNARLRQQIIELEEVIKKKGLVTPANELQREVEESQESHDEHVRRMVEKGREEEELDLT